MYYDECDDGRKAHQRRGSHGVKDVDGVESLPSIVTDYVGDEEKKLMDGGNRNYREMLRRYRNRRSYRGDWRERRWLSRCGLNAQATRSMLWKVEFQELCRVNKMCLAGVEETGGGRYGKGKSTVAVSGGSGQPAVRSEGKCACYA